MDALIVGRAICGAGDSGMYFGSMGLLTQMTSDRERPLYLNRGSSASPSEQAQCSAPSSAAPLPRAVLPGDGHSTCEWSAIFPKLAVLYVLTSESSNLVVGAVCAPIYLFLLPTLNPRPGQ